ncbi:MAG: LarC family nickel insertion protein [Candidatus Wallbacteria bacterium]|nr:LarC family nickel insertion protein [Candidatus Wallbacteria bacterium]
MKSLHFDIFAGISGDMILGALVDCGLAAGELEAQLSRMALPGFRLQACKVARGELSGTKVDLLLPQEDAHRGLRDIERILDEAPYSAWVQERARTIFRRIAEAESLIHQMPLEEIHFHEIGAMDSILDVTGAVLGLELLGVERVTSSSVPLGRGYVDVAHGTMPVPAPATLEVAGHRLRRRQPTRRARAEPAPRHPRRHGSFGRRRDRRARGEPGRHESAALWLSARAALRGRRPRRLHDPHLHEEEPAGHPAHGSLQGPRGACPARHRLRRDADSWDSLRAHGALGAAASLPGSRDLFRHDPREDRRYQDGSRIRGLRRGRSQEQDTDQ